MDETPQEWLTRATRESYEQDRQYRKQVADHEARMAMIVLKGQIAIWNAYHEGIVKAFSPKMRVTVAM